MKAITLSICMAALLFGLASCNKQPQEQADSGSDSPPVQTTAQQPPVLDDPAAQPCGEQPDAQTDGAASARGIPDFSLRSPEGEVRQISSFYGRPLVINFWGDWCPPCVAELPTMNKIYNERKSEFDMICVSVGSKDGLGFWQANKLDIPLYFDVDGQQQLGLGSFPTTFFIDSGGKVVGFQTGEMTETDFTVRLAGILVPPTP